MPRRESGPLDFRVRQAAFDVMTRVRGSVADRELHLDWALGAMNAPAILKAITGFEGTPAGECAAARARVAAPQMGGHERRAAVAARAHSRPEASPSAPRAITAASSPPLAASTTSMPSGAAAATATDVRLQCFTGASWLRPRARTPPLLCHIERVCDTTTRPRRQQRRRETIETRIAITIGTTNTTGLPLQYRAGEDHGGEQALGQPPEPHKGAGAGPGSEEPLLADGRWRRQMGCTARARPALTPAQPQQALPCVRDEEHGRREERIQQRARVRFLAFVFPGFSFLDGPTCPCEECLDLALCRFAPLPRSFLARCRSQPEQLCF